MNTAVKRSITLILVLVTLLSAIVLPTQVHATTLSSNSASSKQVENLEKNLIGLGYLGGTANKYFDTKTKNAVEKYQKNNGLADDGIVGRNTQVSIRNTVIRLQAELAILGYYEGDFDGIYGGLTKDAVRQFQRAKGLRVDGIAGSATWNVINAITPKFKVKSTLSDKSEGTQVKYLQDNLVGLGFLSEANKSKEYGLYSTYTLQAVKAYQATFGLAQTGKADKNTLFSIKNMVVAMQCRLATMKLYYGTQDGLYDAGVKSALEKVSVTPLYQTGDMTRFYNNKKTIQAAGCAGVSIAMVLNTLKNKKSYTGVKSMNWFCDNGFYQGNGTVITGIEQYAEHQLLTSFMLKKDQKDYLIKYLKQGYMAVTIIQNNYGNKLFYDGKKNSGGHYIVISGYRYEDGTDQFYICNPLKKSSNKCQGNGWYTWTQLNKNLSVGGTYKTLGHFVVVG